MNRKTIISLLAIPVAVLLLLVAPAAVQAQWYSYTNAGSIYFYSINADGTSITITECLNSGFAIPVTIPANINGLAVTSIGENAFADITSLTSITIPASVINIGLEAFEGCTNLTSVYFQSNAPTADLPVFSGDRSATVYYLPGASGWGSTFAGLPTALIYRYTTNAGAITIIGYSGLGGAVTLPANINGLAVTSIGQDAFFGANLIIVTIPGSVSSIGGSAFFDCINLTSVCFTGNAPSADSSVFLYDNNATIYYLPGTTGWSSPFAGRPAMLWYPPVQLGYSIANGTISIAKYIGSGGAATIPSTINGLVVASIGQEAFADITSLTSITIPASVTSIGQEAFFGVGLTNVTIPSSVTSIGYGAFCLCTNLTSVYFTGNAPSADSSVFLYDNNATIYYLPGTTGWSSPFAGRPAKLVPLPVITAEPVSQTVEAGSNVTIQVIAIGANTLTYKWLFNGGKLANGSHVSGATNAALILKNVTTANTGSYQVFVTNSYGSATSTVATVTVEAPPSITTQPANESPALGGIATFSVQATGTPLTYQWIFDGAPMSDNGHVTGSASNKLTVNLVMSNDVGSYSVVVANSFVSITSKVVQLSLTRETSKPSIAIASPKPNSRTNAPVLTGTASDSVRVLNVAYWVTNVNNGVKTTMNGIAALTAGTGSLSNWTIQTALLPGTNILAVQSWNYAGLASPVESAAFFNRVTTPIQLLVSPAGKGTVTGIASVNGDAHPTNGAALYVGEGYTLTANPAKNWWLTNWTKNSIVAGTNTTLAFIMESNLVVKANFATNLFVGMAARYDGIFYPSSPQPATETNSGLIYNLVLGTNGVFSGKMYLASGTPYTLAGAFDRSGQATETIKRGVTAGGNVTLQLNIPWQGVPRQITGLVQGSNAGGWISTNLNLYAAATNTNNFPAYTVLLPQDTNVAGAAPSYGYALITNMASMVHIGGALSDGTSFSSFVEPINEQDEFPVYASLYNNTGLLVGELSLDAASNATVPAGSLIWFKPVLHTGLYTNGFTASLDVEGSRWTNSAAALAGLFPNEAQLTFSGGGLASNLVSMVQMTSSNTLRRVSGATDFASGTVNRPNGLMTLTFTNTSGKKVTASGTILQNTGQGGGFFLGATNAGSILLQP